MYAQWLKPMSKKHNPFSEHNQPNVPCKRSSSAAPLTNAKRLKTVSGLASVGGISRTGLATVLRSLSDQGLLTHDLCSAGSASSYNRHIRNAVEDIPLHAPTLYGPLLQSLELPIVDAKRTTGDDRSSKTMLHYVHPMALLSYLASTNIDLFRLVKSTAERVNHRLRICLYVDEINPGNPLAPDPQQLLEATYWTILDFPEWFLHRKASWFCFSLTRTVIVHKLPGFVSELMKLVLNVFFPAVGDSFARGCHLQNAEHGGAIVVTAKFAGFLADEKGLKEIFDIKGQAGTSPCLSCPNIRNRWVAFKSSDGLQHFWDPDLSKRTCSTDATIRIVIDRLKEAAKGPKGPLKKLQTDTGVNYCPTGILFDDHLMHNVISVPHNYIRDSMHTLTSNGVAGTHLALMCQKLGEVGCSLEIIRTYSKQFTLPRCRNRGKVSDMYFKDALMMSDHVRHFASDVLGMIPLLFAFLIEKIQPRGLLTSHIRCFSLLHIILCILRRGEMNAYIHSKLSAIISQHNTMFLELYGNHNAKIKFHHLYHIPDDLLEAGSAINCYVTERKNKDALAVSVATDKNVERSAIISFLHRTIATWRENHNVCQPMYLRGGHDVNVGDGAASYSKSACLPCGDIVANDMVLLVNGSIGMVMDFWKRPNDQSINVRLCEHNKINGLHFELESHIMIDDINCIVEALAWYKDVNHIVACLPFYDK